jgi:ppGpp synthetase/RelA/SpoT-type nucleotidyltranferase
MAWIVPTFSKSEVNNAGKVLIDTDASDADLEQSLSIINNWRSSHSFPLNTMQMGLRRKANHVDPQCLVSQRLKRLSSITQKLIRFPTMKLSQMQDIGGCRAVVQNIPRLNHLRRHYSESQMRHPLIRTDDYVAAPKLSGYRSVHLIYRYQSDRSDTYNGLQVEVQLRTKLQHAWATAVETVGTLQRQALKSSQGSEDWLRFFVLMGSAIAIREKSPIVPNTPSDPSTLYKSIRVAAKRLDVISRLDAYGSALRTISEDITGKSHYYLLALNPTENELSITPFRVDELERANRQYLLIEQRFKNIPAADAVLVSVESVASLNKAYPNYFLDTRLFLRAVKRVIA